MINKIIVLLLCFGLNAVAVDQVEFSASGGESEFVWDATPNYLGIGTGSPSTLIDVKEDAASTHAYIRLSATGSGSDAGFILQSSQGDAYLRFNMNSDWAIGVDGTSSDLLFVQDDDLTATAKMILTTDGDVGIGTESPVTLLHVHESAVSTASEIAITNGSTGSASADGFHVGIDGSQNAILDNSEVTDMVFTTNGKTMRFESDGDLIVGSNLKWDEVGDDLEVTGSIGVGTAAPNGLLDLEAASGPYIEITQTSATPKSWRIGDGVGTSNGYFVIRDHTSGANRITITSTGDVGIGTANPVRKLGVAGDIRIGTSGSNGCLEDFGGGNLAGTCVSDKRFKKNIKAISNILNKITSLIPSTFNWKSEEYPERSFGNDIQLGLIAQEVQETLPELVHEKDGFFAVDYSGLNMYILQGLIELKNKNEKEISDLKAENDQLKDNVLDLDSRMNYFEKLLKAKK